MPAPPATPTIDEVVAAIPAWHGREIGVESIGGGLTNRNYRVDVDGKPHFVRIPGRRHRPARDRPRERAPQHPGGRERPASGPGVLEHLPRWDVMVLEWLPGRTMSNGAFAEPTSPARIATALQRLHAGPRFLLDFDMFRLTEFYLGVVDERCDPRSPPAFGGPASCRPIEAALASRRCPASPATTTFWPRTTSTMASGCGSSTTSTAATTTRPSSSATPARSSALTRRGPPSCAPRTSAWPHRRCSPGCDSR